MIWVFRKSVKAGEAANWKGVARRSRKGLDRPAGPKGAHEEGEGLKGFSLRVDAPFVSIESRNKEHLVAR